MCNDYTNPFQLQIQIIGVHYVDLKLQIYHKVYFEIWLDKSMV